MGALPILSVVLAGGGLALNAVGQIKAGNAAKRAGESAAQQQEFNAAVAEQQAQDALIRGAGEEQNFRTQVRGLLGTQRAGFAGQGVDLGVGSPVDVQADTAFVAEQDALQIRQNAEREAWGYGIEAIDRRMAADVARKGGQAQASASRWGAAGTVAGGAGSILLSRYGWERPRTTPPPTGYQLYTGPSVTPRRG